MSYIADARVPHFTGLSSEAKPGTTFSLGEVKPQKGSWLTELDTGLEWFFDGSQWLPSDTNPRLQAIHKIMQEILFELKAIRLGSDLITDHDLRRG